MLPQPPEEHPCLYDYNCEGTRHSGQVYCLRHEYEVNAPQYNRRYRREGRPELARPISGWFWL